MCPVCPVQGNSSKCTEGKRSNWKNDRKKAGEILEEYYKDPSTYDMEFSELKEHELAKQHNYKPPKEDEMLEVYCSIGMSNCDDLDKEKMCICPDCQVWQNHELKSYKYCLNGNADEVEG